MSKHTPSVTYFPQRAHGQLPNASYSRVYLSRHNNRSGQRLHGSSVKRNEFSEIPSHISSTKAAIEVMDLTDADIIALPLSSSDDEEISEDADDMSISTEQTSNSSKSKRKLQHTSPENENKRSKTTARKPILSQSKQRSKTVAEGPDKILISSSQGEPDNWFDFSQTHRSQSSQGNKRATYGKSNVCIAEQKSNTKKSTGLLGLPEEIDSEGYISQKNKKAQRAKFSSVPAIPPSPVKRRKRGGIDFEAVSPSNESKPSKPKFDMPDDLDMDLDLGSEKTIANAKRRSTVNDGTLFSTRAHRRNSSAASDSSALSDVDSVVSLQLTQSQKDDLKNGTTQEPATDLPSTHTRCPICSSPVAKNIVSGMLTKTSESPKSGPHQHHTETEPNELSRLSLHKQQDICHRHQIHDAKILWTEEGYPQRIDWQQLETTRLPAMIPELRKILYRKTSPKSYYLDALEREIHKAKGNKTKLKRFLNEGIVDIVKPGYLGPRGTKIMGHIITENLAKALRFQQSADKTVMTVGVSGYVSAVLIPEMAVRVVMEDMHLTDQDEARTVLEQSTHVGLLLCPDDDHVDLQDGD